MRTQGLGAPQREGRGGVTGSWWAGPQGSKKGQEKSWGRGQGVRGETETEGMGLGLGLEASRPKH